MTKNEKVKHLENILSSIDLFDDLLSLDSLILLYRPETNFWTIQEHIVHCMEVDIANFSRYRKGIVHPGSDIMPMDEMWTSKLDYNCINLNEAVQMIKLIRKISFSHLSTLIHQDWKAFSFNYDKYGILDFETVIPALAKHPVFHRELIERNLDAYNQNQ